MARISETTVLIVGAGPVGMTLAMDLRSRGVDVLVVEKRDVEEPWTARCNTIAARTMEIFRRLGVADKVRAVGLPDDYPNDVVWMTRANGAEIARVPLASRATRFTDMTVADAGWPTPEPVHRASQLIFDRVLRDHAQSDWDVGFVDRCEVFDFLETAEGVTAWARPGDGGEAFPIRCRYLVGCDGGRSTIRSRLGAKLSGDNELFRSRSSLIRAPWMLGHLKSPPAWMTHFLGPGPFGGMIAIDGKDLWLVQAYLPRGVTRFEDLDVDDALRRMLDLPDHLQYELVHREDWVARRLIADRFCNGRVFICGDAAHLWPPFGGHGMNAGIADAADLAWILAAVIQGWGGMAMLGAYEAERQPVTDQVSRFAMDKVISYLAANRKDGPAPDYDRADEIGRDNRASAAQRLLTDNGPQYATAGLNFAYYYDNSPIIAYDGEAAPAYTMGSYTPSTAPGCRAPNFRLPDGAWLHDRLGSWYTLLRFDPAVEVGPLVAAAAARGLPLTLLEVENPTPALFRHALLLVRPDQHVGWRDDQVPDDPGRLVDLLRGACVNWTLGDNQHTENKRGNKSWH